MNKIGKYTLIESEGSGSNGVVYRAIDPDLDRIVAIKIVKKSAYIEKNKKIIQKEARAIAKIVHKNIIVIYDLLEIDQSIALVMQHVAGQNLRAWLEQGRNSIETMLPMMAQLASAFAAAHDIGLIHGDIKPENIMVGADDIPYVVDFGLARIRGDDDALQTLLSSADDLTPSLDGTLPYLAPEKIMGRHADDRSDIFSLGAVFYEMVSGRRAFAGGHQGAVLHAILNVHPPDLLTVRPQAPAWLGALIDAMLAKDPGQRIGSMKAVEQRLGGDRQAAPAPATPVRTLRSPDGTGRWQRLAARRWLLIPALIVPLLIWLAAMALGYEVRPVSFRMAKGIDLIGHFERKGAIEDAKALFSGILSADPRHAGAEAGLALSLMREYTSRETDPAILRRATALARSAHEDDPQQGLTNIAAAWAAEFNGDFTEATRLYDRADGLDPAHMLSLEGRARLLKKQKDLAAATRLLERAIRLWPDHRLFYDAYGEILALQGDFAAAERQFRKGIAVEPDNIQGYANLAQSLHMQGKTRDAIATIQQGLTIGKSTSLYNNLGTYLFVEGRYEQAVEAFQQTLAVEGNAHDYLAWANLADAQRQVPSLAAKAKDSYRRSIQLLRKERNRRPRDETLNSRLALYAAKAGDTATARTALQVATSVATRDPRTYFRAAITHELLGNRAKALADLQRALAAGYPDDEIENDPDLSAVRQDPAYQLMIMKWETDK